MRFREGRAIHEQIVDYVVEEILDGRWEEGRRLPSVREMAVELGVNPNTVQRSYGGLQELELVFNKRGIGYFVDDGARDRARAWRRARFERETLPDLFREMESLDIDIEDLRRAWTQRKGAER
jgi:DNA-binding transcriptional regulator YhcF (GntR family)